MYLSALIVPDFEALKEYADSHKIDYTKIEDLSENKVIKSLIENELGKFRETLPTMKKSESLLCLRDHFLLRREKLLQALKLKEKWLKNVTVKKLKRCTPVN